LTTRERNLLILLLIAAGTAMFLAAASSYLERLTRLDSAFVDLQKRALRAAQARRMGEKTAVRSSGLSGLKERFYAAGTLQDPLTLATHVQGALRSSELAIVESRVTESSEAAQWVQYHVEGQIESWFRFLQLLRNVDPMALFRSLSIVRKDGALYSITFEVGHVVLP
jgi:hypothetical protein